MKIIIFGGAGFIGFHLAKKLAEDKNNVITIADNFARGELDNELKELCKQSDVNYFPFDILKPEQFDKLNSFDYVYHLAAVNGTKNFYEHPNAVLMVNTLGTYNVLNWFCKSKCKKILFTSSSETYAGTKDKAIPTPETVALTVEDVFNPRWSYAGSKIIGELFVINMCRKYKKRFSIIRYHNIYGPRMGDDHVIPEFCQRIKNKETPFNIYGGIHQRAFCYVSDGVDGTIQVMESPKADGQLYHIGNPEETTMIKLAQQMCELQNHSPTFKIHPAPEGSTLRRCPDITKLKGLGYSPKVSLTEGLKKTMEWYIK